MKKHGWQLPYHPLQVVAVAVFLALGFAYYVFFAPFVGKKMLQFIFMGLYTPLITCCFGLYIWCAAADPADPGVFKSKKYRNIPENGKPSTTTQKEFKLGGESASSLPDGKVVEKPPDGDTLVKDDENSKASVIETEDPPRERSSFFLLACFAPCSYVCKCSGSSRESSLHMSEEGMFFCSLCEVEVFKYSKHCRVCDKCVDRFDHHCRWLNNCIGKRNYRQFFTLMVSAILLLVLQWVTGLFVLICCFIERKRFDMEIATKLGSSFSLVPFVMVVALCTLLAMVATLPLVQLFFFHILLMKKGISTYDYIIALREQEQEQQGVGGQQSPQMSPASSLTGLSSASSFSTFNRGAWCTPPRLFLEDQFDVVPPETASVSSLGKKTAATTAVEETSRKKNPAAVKISPWALAKLNAEDISRAAAEARKKSKILQPVAARRESAPFRADSIFGSSSGLRMGPRPDNSYSSNNDNNNNRRRGGNKRVRLPAELPMVSAKAVAETPSSSSLAPLQLEARSAFQTRNAAVPTSAGIVRLSSPESSQESPDILPFRVSSSGAEDNSQRLNGISTAAAQNDFPLSRSTSDGYEASGGEDSDRVPSRFTQRSTNWSNALFSSEPDDRMFKLTMASSSSSQADRRMQ